MAGSFIKVSGDSKVAINTKVADSIVKRLAQNSGSYVTVGVHSDAGTYEDVTPEGGKPVPVAKVALWIEYGTRFMEKRPFLYSTIIEKQRVLARLLSQAEAAIVAGKKSVADALASVGFEAQTFVQNAIKSNTPPPLSDAYLARRRQQFPEAGSRTLLRTGLLLRSIRYKLFVHGREVRAPDAGQPAGAHAGGPEARARGRKDMRADKARRASQRSAARKDPKAAQRAFDGQRRVRPPRSPNDKNS